MMQVDQVGTGPMGSDMIAGDAIFRGVDVDPTRQFVPYLDEKGRLGPQYAAHLLRRRAVAEDLFDTVWHDADGAEPVEQQRIFSWMRSRPDRWTAWGRMAVGFGASSLSRVIQDEIAADAVLEQLTEPGC